MGVKTYKVLGPLSLAYYLSNIDVLAACAFLYVAANVSLSRC